MTTAERLTKIAENVPRVYEAGFNVGKAQGGGAEYEFEDISLVTLKEQGRMTVVDDDGYVPAVITDNSISDDYCNVAINISGYVEMSGICSSCDAVTLVIDGNAVYTYTGYYSDEPFEYKGKVNESIAFRCDMGSWTFDRFVIRKDYDKGYADGKQAECDRFWDEYQLNGKRRNYANAFAGQGWSEATFKPRYDMDVTNAYMMFYQNSHIYDLVDALEKCGVELNFSDNETLQYAFAYSKLTRIGVIDASKVNSFSNTFQNASSLVTIEKLVLSLNTLQKFSNTFSQCSALENITIEGVIGQSGLDFQWSTKLTAESLLSILTALSKDSAVASGKSITFSSASRSVIETDTRCLMQLSDATQAGWEIKYA